MLRDGDEVELVAIHTYKKFIVSQQLGESWALIIAYTSPCPLERNGPWEDMDCIDIKLTP